MDEDCPFNLASTFEQVDRAAERVFYFVLGCAFMGLVWCVW